MDVRNVQFENWPFVLNETCWSIQLVQTRRIIPLPPSAADLRKIQVRPKDFPAKARHVRGLKPPLNHLHCRKEADTWSLLKSTNRWPTDRRSLPSSVPR